MEVVGWIGDNAKTENIDSFVLRDNDFTIVRHNDPTGRRNGTGSLANNQVDARRLRAGGVQSHLRHTLVDLDVLSPNYGRIPMIESSPSLHSRWETA